jgi:hypothetical protein
MDRINPSPNVKKKRIKKENGKNRSAKDNLAPNINAMINKQIVLKNESISTENAFAVMNNCFGRYIFLIKLSFIMRDCEH